jgi:hypothetical protein
MEARLPLSLKVTARTSAFILDAALALEPLGLLTALRLAPFAPVWLPRSFWGLLDNDSFYRAHPDRLGGMGHDDAARAAMAAQLPGWHRAWSYGRLSASLYWVGDAHYESRLPEGIGGELLPRFERCAAALDAAWSRRQLGSDGPLAECARDSLALAAAMQPDPVTILTPGGGDAPPLLCDLFEQAGLDASVIALPGRAAAPPGALLPLAAHRRRYAAVHVIAPAALAFAEAIDETEEDVFDADPAPWAGAALLWQRVEAR